MIFQVNEDRELCLQVSETLAAVNLRELKSLKSFLLVAVSKDPADSQDTGLKWMRHFVSGHFDDVRRQATMPVYTV